MTTNLLSVIEQLVRAARFYKNITHDNRSYETWCGMSESEANAAVSAAQQALEQEQVEAIAWDEGYAAGVNDERISESNIGVAGFGAKVNPARENPYRRIHPQATEPAPSTAGERAEIIRKLKREVQWVPGKHYVTQLEEIMDEAAALLQPTAMPAPDGEVAKGTWEHLKLMMEASAWEGKIVLSDALANIDEFAAMPVGELTQPDLETVIDNFIEDYEMHGESEDGQDAYYVPNENDKALLKDAICGLLADTDWDNAWGAHIAALAAASSQPVREPLTDEELDLICEKALFCRISFQ